MAHGTHIFSAGKQSGGCLIQLKNCSIENRGIRYFSSFSWEMKPEEAWLVTGANGGGKSTLAAALAGKFDIIPQKPEDGDAYVNVFSGSVISVSFEEAAALIAEERARDDSDYVEGGIDTGRTPRMLVTASLGGAERKQYPEGRGLENHPAVSLCSIERVLDRGLRYLSTGEIRRTLLCRALAAKPALLILDQPFEGLDTASRDVLAGLLGKLARDTVSAPFPVPEGQERPVRLLLLSDRFEYVPEAVNRVLEMSRTDILFEGTRAAYEAVLKKRETEYEVQKQERSENINRHLHEARATAHLVTAAETEADGTENAVLVEMNGVTVEWSGKKVLDNIYWTLRKGEHWLIRGPNGSGKTTFLELITGDNTQVFRNDVRIFGSPRGSGETIWELKEKMGIVSYRLHLEYRMVGDIDLEGGVLSGLHDSIGLYRGRTEAEREAVRQWLRLGGFENRGHERFAELSYGEQRAVLIIRAAVKCPPILILDEPCHGLDDTHRKRVLELLQAIAESGTSTLLHVTHDPQEALPCETHIMELRPEETPMYRIFHT